MLDKHTSDKNKYKHTSKQEREYGLRQRSRGAILFILGFGGGICKIRMSKQELHFLLKLFLTFKHTIMATIDFSIVAFP